MDFDEDDKQVLSIPGISSICTPDITSYTDPTVCFDVSYNDTVNGSVVQVKAKLEPGYFINESGFLEIVPYGYVVSSNKRAYVTKTHISNYVEGSFANTNAAIDVKIKAFEDLKNATTDPEKIKIYKQKIDDLKKQKLSVMDSNTTSNKMYNSDNLDITYHADPTQETSPDSNNLAVGQMWMKDPNGNLSVVAYKDELNTTHYYPSGSYVFNPPTYVPNYEESVFLSKMTNLPTVADVDQNIRDINTNGSTVDKETKCNGLDHTSCKNSEYCILFGGEKCIAGNDTGPEIKSNYSDITIMNRDYYYYKDKCYGNCP